MSYMNEDAILRAVVDDFAPCPFCGHGEQHIYEDSRGWPNGTDARMSLSAHIECRCGARLYSRLFVGSNNTARSLEQLVEHFRAKWGERHVP